MRLTYCVLRPKQSGAELRQRTQQEQDDACWGFPCEFQIQRVSKVRRSNSPEAFPLSNAPLGNWEVMRNLALKTVLVDTRRTRSSIRDGRGDERKMSQRRSPGGVVERWTQPGDERAGRRQDDSAGLRQDEETASGIVEWPSSE